MPAFEYTSNPNQYDIPLTPVDELPGQDLLEACDPLTRKVMIAGLSAVAFAAGQDSRLNRTHILGDGLRNSIHIDHSEWFRNGRGLGPGYIAASGACVVALAQATSNVLRSTHPTQVESTGVGELTGVAYPVRHIIMPIENPSLQDLVNVQIGAFHPVESVQVGMSADVKGSEALEFATTGAGAPSPFGPRSSFLTILTSYNRVPGRVGVQLEAGANMGVFGVHTGASFPRLAAYARFMNQFAAGGEAVIREISDQEVREWPLRHLFRPEIDGEIGDDVQGRRALGS